MAVAPMPIAFYSSSAKASSRLSARGSQKARGRATSKETQALHGGSTCVARFYLNQARMVAQRPSCRKTICRWKPALRAVGEEEESEPEVEPPATSGSDAEVEPEPFTKQSASEPEVEPCVGGGASLDKLFGFLGAVEQGLGDWCSGLCSGGQSSRVCRSAKRRPVVTFSTSAKHRQVSVVCRRSSAVGRPSFSASCQSSAVGRVPVLVHV